jgi:hypothetical protein
MELVAVKMGRINLLDLLGDSVVYRKNNAKSRAGPPIPPPACRAGRRPCRESV